MKFQILPLSLDLWPIYNDQPFRAALQSSNTENDFHNNLVLFGAIHPASIAKLRNVELPLATQPELRPESYRGSYGPSNSRSDLHQLSHVDLLPFNSNLHRKSPGQCLGDSYPNYHPQCRNFDKYLCEILDKRSRERFLYR
jgi:hypothetical protein